MTGTMAKKRTGSSIVMRTACGCERVVELGLFDESIHIVIGPGKVRVFRRTGRGSIGADNVGREVYEEVVE